MRPQPARLQAGAAGAASTTRECPSLSAPTGLAGGLARKRCARPWTDKALRPDYLGPPFLASDEDSAISRRRVPDLPAGELHVGDLTHHVFAIAGEIPRQSTDVRGAEALKTGNDAPNTIAPRGGNPRAVNPYSERRRHRGGRAHRRRRGRSGEP